MPSDTGAGTAAGTAVIAPGTAAGTAVIVPGTAVIVTGTAVGIVAGDGALLVLGSRAQPLHPRRTHIHTVITRTPAMPIPIRITAVAMVTATRTTAIVIRIRTGTSRG